MVVKSIQYYLYIKLIYSENLHQPTCRFYFRSVFYKLPFKYFNVYILSPNH